MACYTSIPICEMKRMINGSLFTKKTLSKWGDTLGTSALESQINSRGPFQPKLSCDSDQQLTLLQLNQNFYIIVCTFTMITVINQKRLLHSLDRKPTQSTTPLPGTIITMFLAKKQPDTWLHVISPYRKWESATSWLWWEMQKSQDTQRYSTCIFCTAFLKTFRFQTSAQWAKEILDPLIQTGKMVCAKDLVWTIHLRAVLSCSTASLIHVLQKFTSSKEHIEMQSNMDISFKKEAWFFKLEKTYSKYPGGKGLHQKNTRKEI